MVVVIKMPLVTELTVVSVVTVVKIGGEEEEEVPKFIVDPFILLTKQ